MKPGKHQRSKQRCQDFYWEVHDRAQSFVLYFILRMNFVNNAFLLVRSSERSKQGEGQKTNKNLQQRCDGFHNHSTLLTRPKSS